MSPEAMQLEARFAEKHGEVAQTKSRQCSVMANRYAENVEDYGQEVCEPDEADVDSSKGSAWPSETSRLTPHQSIKMMQQSQQQQQEYLRTHKA